MGWWVDHDWFVLNLNAQLLFPSPLPLCPHNSPLGSFTMDQTRAALQQQVAHVVNNPNVPDEVKTMLQNFAGMAYYNQGILSMTLASNQTKTLSPFASMNSTINVDFHAFDGKQLDEIPAGENAGFRRFPLIIEVGQVQLVQARLYTTQPLVGRYVTQRQAANVMPAFRRLFHNFVTTLREREGAMSCAGVPNNQPCNKSNIVILICKMETAG